MTDKPEPDWVPRVLALLVAGFFIAWAAAPIVAEFVGAYR